MPVEIASAEVFQEYRKVFDKKKFGKNADLNAEWLKFVKECEAEKLHYFMLVKSAEQNVLVVKMPSETKEKKAFLGYEWSSAKGSEGIKYLTTQASDEEDSLSQLKGINQIQTPLFNPNNLSDDNKLNALIRQNFSAKNGKSAVQIPKDLQKFAQSIPLVEMLDFGRTEFDKVIRANVQKKLEITSKYDLTKLDNVSDIYRGVTYSKSDQTNEVTGKIILPADNIALEGRFEINKPIYLHENIQLDETKKLKKNDMLLGLTNVKGSGIIIVAKKNDIFMCFSSGSEKHVGKLCLIEVDTEYYAGGFMGILRTKGDILPKYLYNVLNQENMRDAVRQLSSGSNIKNLSNSIGNVKIPLPPLDIQQQIVAECEKIDHEFENSRMKIERYRGKIAKIFNDLEVISGG